MKYISYRETIRIFLTLFLLVLSYNSQSQYHIENLTGKGRPQLSNPEKFVKDIKENAENIIRNRLGDYYYNLMVDSNYKYQWYYDNVYFNSAASEMNYRVAFWLNRLQTNSYHFELKYSPDSLKLILPAENYLPDCKNNPTECIFIDKEEAGQIARKALNSYFRSKGNSRFAYDNTYSTFVWNYYVSRYRQYPKGDIGTVIIDANDGRVLASKLDTNIWMGKCLSFNTEITTTNGQKKVHQIQTGDTVMSYTADKGIIPLPVLRISKDKVNTKNMMLKVFLEDGRNLTVSPEHPTIDPTKRFFDLKAGDILDGSLIIQINTIPFTEFFTYDILTAGKNGGYIANGIITGSTLSKEFIEYTENSTTHNK